MSVKLSDDEFRALSAEIARRERAEQGLPEVMDDPATYAYIARVLASEPKDAA